MTHAVSLEHVDLAMPDGTCDAYLAHPTAAGPWPGVLFIMDAIGLRPRIADMVERVASWGYAVLAPNTFYRVGRQPLVDPALLTVERQADRMALFGTLIPSLTTALWAVDGPAYLEHLAAVSYTHLDVYKRQVLDRGFRVPAAVIAYAARLLPHMAPGLGVPESVRDHPGDLVIEHVDDRDLHAAVVLSLIHI